MRYTNEELNEIVGKAVSEQKIITLKTYALTDYGEKVLLIIITSILEYCQRKDLIDVAYTAAKELVINATKANLKRLIFDKKAYDWQEPEIYNEGLEEFRSYLSEYSIQTYEEQFKKKNLPVTATFYFTEDVLNIKVKNNFSLYPIEERRIREKFSRAHLFSNLVEFYMEHGDNSEGAGLGLTMVSILLEQSEIDRHSFILYSSEKYNETIAKIELPLTDKYISKREMFSKIMEEQDISAEQLRTIFDYNYKGYQKLKSLVV